MDRRALWLVLGVATMALATTAHMYTTGLALMWIKIVSLVIAGGVLVMLLKSPSQVQSKFPSTGSSDLRSFLRIYRFWAITYFLSSAMIFFGLWVLNDLYLSENGQVFSRSMTEPAIACLVLGLALFALSNHKTRE